METLFDDILHCPPERLVDYYSGQTLDTLPIFLTLGEFDRDVSPEETALARDLVVQATRIKTYAQLIKLFCEQRDELTAMLQDSTLYDIRIRQQRGVTDAS